MLERPLDSKEIKPVHPKGNQPKYSLEGLLLSLKLQYFGHLMQRADSLEKILMLGRAEGRRRRGRQRMAGYYDQFDESEFEQTPRESEGQGSLVCCSPCKESDMTERLTNKQQCRFGLLMLFFPRALSFILALPSRWDPRRDREGTLMNEKEKLTPGIFCYS